MKRRQNPMADILQELSEPSRRVVLSNLLEGPKNVSELVAATAMKQPNLSNHLAKLKAKGVVRSNKVGRQVYYSLATPEIAHQLNSMLSASKAKEPNSMSLEMAAKVYAKAAVRGEEADCAAIIDQLMRQGLALTQIYQHVLAASMELIGRWYQAEAVDEAQEHLASAITDRMMARTMQFTSPLSPSAETAVLGCVPENYHSLGLRMLSDFLRLSGWKTIYLGANVPVPAFVASVREHTPQLVMVSCARMEGLSACQALMTDLLQLRESLKFRVGIGGFAVNENPRAFEMLKPDFTSTSLQEFSESIYPTLAKSETRKQSSA